MMVQRCESITNLKGHKFTSEYPAELYHIGEGHPGREIETDRLQS